MFFLLMLSRWRPLWSNRPPWLLFVPSLLPCIPLSCSLLPKRIKSYYLNKPSVSQFEGSIPLFLLIEFTRLSFNSKRYFPNYRNGSWLDLNPNWLTFFSFLPPSFLPLHPSFHFSFLTGSYYVTQADLELGTLLPKCYNYRFVLSWNTEFNLSVEYQQKCFLNCMHWHESVIRRKLSWIKPLFLKSWTKIVWSLQLHFTDLKSKQLAN